MKISFFTASMHRYPLEKSFEVAAQFGYDGIEIWGGRPHALVSDMRPEDIEQINALSERYGLPVVCFEPDMQNPLWRDQRWIDESIEYFKQCLDFCKEIHCPYMVMAALQASYGYSTDDDWALFIKNMKLLTDHSEQIDGPVMLLKPSHPGKVIF
jgi:protein FrlC